MSEIEIGVGVAAVAEVATGEDADHNSPVFHAKHDHRMARPVIRRASGSAISVSTTVPTIIEIGAPREGHVWDVRRVTLQGSDPFAAAVTVPCALLVQVDKPDAANIEPRNVVDYGQAYPLVWTEGRHGLMVLPPNRVWVGVVALTTGVQFVCTLLAHEIEVR